MYAFDIETRSLDKSRDNFSLAAIYNTEDEELLLLEYDDTLAWLKEHSLTSMIIGHNIVGFDLEWFPHFPIDNVWDTLLMSKILIRDANMSHSLGACLTRIGEHHTEKDMDVTDREWDLNNLTDQELSYIQQDVILLPKLFKHLYDIIIELDLEHVTRLEHKVRRRSNYMERRGLPLLENNISIAKKSANANVKATALPINVNSYQQVSDAILGQGLIADPRLRKCKEVGIPIKRHKTTGRIYIGTDETNRHKCIMNDINPNVAIKIDKAKRAKAPLKHIAWMLESNNRLYSRYDNLRTQTGRFAASKYAIQQMNRGLRTCFGHTESEGKVVVKADWSQMELRLHAALNRDPEMTQVLEEELDMHAMIACDAFGVKECSAEQRNLGKTANFTLLYMGGPTTLHNRLIKEGNYVSPEVADRLYRAFHSNFPAVRDTASAIKAHAEATFNDDYICRIWGGLVRRVSWSTDELGMWHFPLPTVMNTRVQGAGGAVLKRALLMLDSNIVENYLSATVHDEIVLTDVPAKEAEDIGGELKAVMSYALSQALRNTLIKPKVDVNIGLTWGG